MLGTIKQTNKSIEIMNTHLIPKECSPYTVSNFFKKHKAARILNENRDIKNSSRKPRKPRYQEILKKTRISHKRSQRMPQRNKRAERKANKPTGYDGVFVPVCACARTDALNKSWLSRRKLSIKNTTDIKIRTLMSLYKFTSRYQSK